LALRHWLQLALTSGIGPILTTRLVTAAGGAEPAVAANRRLLGSIDGIGPNKAGAIFDALRESAGEVDAELERCAAAGIELIAQDDARYPVLLRAIPDPPPVLYVKGAIEDRDLNALAIVGSRTCSFYGREQAERFAGLLSGAGMTVMSGGARGIDSAAHRGALAHPKGRTIAVLGCGLDVVYPPENESLFGQIVERGALISEFRMGTPPLKENFPRRNRIVSGMSRGVLVIEADLASGALITARQACDDHGRPVFALPGRVDNGQSAGPHALIRDGAVLTTGLPDILDNLAPLPASAMEFTPAEEAAVETSAPEEKLPAPDLTDRQRQILDGLGSDAADVDAVIARTDLAAHVVLQELTVLSLRGLVKRVDGQTYVRR
jgi:DNA processing protein